MKNREKEWNKRMKNNENREKKDKNKKKREKEGTTIIKNNER